MSEAYFQEKNYINRWVSYFDILGFKQYFISKNATLNFARINTLYKDILNKMIQQQNSSNGIQLWWGADSFVFYSNDDSGESYMNIQLCAKNFIRALLNIEVPTRGAIGHGRFLADRKNHIFMGEAYNDACFFAEKQNWIGLVLTLKCTKKLNDLGIDPSFDFPKTMIPIKPENDLEIDPSFELHAFNFKFKANFEPTYLKKLKKMENNAPDKDKIKYQNTIKHIKKRVLILCTGNSCRSQMAEGISKHLFSDSHDIFSAGTQPSYVHPIAIAVMKEIGIDISTYRSKSVDEFKEELFDFVITVCGKADQNCPIFQGPSTRIHWSFNDPAHATGNEETIKNEFRKVRDAIFKKFKTDWMKTFGQN